MCVVQRGAKVVHKGDRKVSKLGCKALVQLVLALLRVIDGWLVAVVPQVACCDQAIAACVKSECASLIGHGCADTVIARAACHKNLGA